MYRKPRGALDQRVRAGGEPVRGGRALDRDWRSGYFLYWLIRRSARLTSVASLFYLVPAVTAAMAYVLFGERLDEVAIVGMIACAAAILVNRRA